MVGRLVFQLAFAGLVLGVLRSVRDVHDSVKVVEVEGSKIREIAVETWPDEGPVRKFKINAQEVKWNEEGDVRYRGAQFEINTYNKTEVGFAYVAAKGSVEDGEPDPNDWNAKIFAMYAGMLGLYEWKDRDGVEGFQYSLDTPVFCLPGGTKDCISNYYHLDKLDVQWKAIEHTQSTFSSDNGTFAVHTFEAQTVDDVFLFRMTVTGHAIQIGPVAITPDNCKLDFEIRYFNNPKYDAASKDDDAQIGLLMGTVVAAGEIEKSLTAENPHISIKVGEFVGFFAWETEADVEVAGVVAAKAVHASVVEGTDIADENVKTMVNAGWVVSLLYFSFDEMRPEVVTWDPEFGADPSSQLDSSGNNIFPQFFTCCFVFLVFQVTKNW